MLYQNVWGKLYSVCDGEIQSPIDIPTSEVVSVSYSNLLTINRPESEDIGGCEVSDNRLF